MQTIDIVKSAFTALDDKSAGDIKVLDIAEITVIADYFIIATGRNVNHTKTLADAVEDALAKCGVHVRHKEGYNGATWILLDFGGIIVHVFTEEMREFYDLEHVWGDAKSVKMV